MWNDTRSRDELIRDDAIEPNICGDCWWRMVYGPPELPFQRCANGHGLAWLDRSRDPEKGLRCFDDDGREDEA